MTTLRNFTLHPQTARERGIAMRAGLFLSPAPEGVEVGAGPDGLREAAERLARLLEECARRGEAALVGGHTGAWIAAIPRADAVPPLYYFDTRRGRDAQGRFVFIPEGLVRI
jgi:hypothetical protein